MEMVGKCVVNSHPMKNLTIFTNTNNTSTLQQTIVRTTTTTIIIIIENGGKKNGALEKIDSFNNRRTVE